jgi:HAD superfamily hydrolase (TIGR01509 family)
MAKLHIFDMGGVVSSGTDVVPAIAQRLGVKPMEFLALAAPDLAGLQSGTFGAAEFWKRYSARSGAEVTEELWGRFFAPVANQDVVSLIRKLRTRGRVVCGTNTIEPHYRVHLHLGDYACFDAVYASHRMGLVKPDPRFFLHILREEGVAPEDAFFVDDDARNVEAARSLGIDAMVFADPEALTAHCERIHGAGRS